MPVLHAPQPLSPSNATDLPRSMQSSQAPWINTTILVVKVKHPWKGYQGVIKDVLYHQETSSGLRVVVQLSHLNPAAPFKTVVFDYDDVVEAVCVQLHINQLFSTDHLNMLDLI